MKSNIYLIEQTNWEQADWQKSRESKTVYRYLTPLLQQGVSSFIPNVDTEVMALHLGEHILPLSVNQLEFTNSYVCSPFNHYVTYAQEELSELKSPALEKSLHMALSLLGTLLKGGSINRVTMVNNWFISTNLYPDINVNQIKEITTLLTQRFPDHAIAFRSVTDHHPSGLMAYLLSQGYLAVPSRQVYYYDPQNWSQLTSKQRNLIRREKRKFRKSGYHIQKKKNWSDEELHTFIDLYNQLYLGKYSYQNPQFSKELLAHALQNNLLRIGALVKQGQINGVYGYYVRNGAMIAPLFGYRTNMPQKEGLYRFLSNAMQQEAHRHKLLHHVSSGCAQFKRDRGGFARMEYTRHLPMTQHQTWNILSKILTSLAVPLLQKKKL